MNTTYKIKEGIWHNNEGLKRKVWIECEENASLTQKTDVITMDEHCKDKLFLVWFEIGLNTPDVKWGQYESIDLAERDIEIVVMQKIQWQFQA
ncbi:MAG: hypothetical protein WCX28_11495 [Bacteriovoracaceae bacterium]|nr:hypothetical protein [Bacteroidota bacterium]